MHQPLDQPSHFSSIAQPSPSLPSQLLSPPTCSSNCLLLLTQSCLNFSQYFQCDQKFEPLSIIPYQVHFIKDHNPLVNSKGKYLNQGLGVEGRGDEMLVGGDGEGGDAGWGKLGSWEWWKMWLCCVGENRGNGGEWDGEEAEEYYVYEKKLGMEGDQDKAFKKGNMDNLRDSKIEQKDQIVFQDDNPFPLSYSHPPISNTLPITTPYPPSNPLNPTLLQVNPKQPQFPGDIGIKRRPRRQFKDPAPTPIPIQLKLNKIEQYNGRNKIENNGSEMNQKLSRDDNLREDEKKRKEMLGARDDFDRLGEALEVRGNGREKEIKHSKTTFIKTKQSKDNLFHPNPHSPSNNQSTLHLPSQSPFLSNPSTFTQQQSFPPSDDKDDTMRKRRKKARNLFNEEIIPIDDLDVVEEAAPEDLAIKKRRRRRKTILNEEKEQEERKERRRMEEREELEVVIYSEDDEI